MNFSSSTKPFSSDLRRRKAEGRALLNANCLAEATEVFTLILQEHPADVETHIWLGNCYLARRDPAKAYQYYARARDLDPQNPIVRRVLRLTGTKGALPDGPHSGSASGRDGAVIPEAPGAELNLPTAVANRSIAKTRPLALSTLISSPRPQNEISHSPPPAQARYLLGLEVFFNARHFVTVDGKAGPIHAHSFRVTVRIRHAAIQPGREYVLGFGNARDLVQSETNQLNDTLLNHLAPYRDNPHLQPTTESLAATIFQRLKQKLTPNLHLESVTVWESPTNSVTYQEETS
jgi:6-pyruvoyl-tetrahydropterin synthase